MPSPRQFVEAIQTDRGLDPAPGGLPTGNRNLRDLGNALKLLSDQLYNSDGHYLLELIQNADDNGYPPGVVPTVTIEVGKDQLVFRNNEVGFSEPNVEAICSIGESTKRGRKTESIGEKGIGFKAVFKVSDRPEVHSRGFHFCFDRKLHGDLGLITPTWLDSPTTAAQSSDTVICLPYKKDPVLAADITVQLRPELLLFLNKLRLLRIVDTTSGLTTELRRQDDGAESKVVRTTIFRGRPTSQTFRYFRHVREVDMSGVPDEMRPDMAKSRVVVAVPLANDGTVDGATGRQLFAFLPIRDSGLRFVAHADFILGTSREDVVRSRPWNLHLRDELGTTLAEAVMAMQSFGNSGRTALRSLSKPAEIADPFIRPILERALDVLKTRACIPVAPHAWAVPAKALRPDHNSLSLLIPEDSAERLVGKYHVDASCTGISEALDLLGVGWFQLADILRACDQSDWLAEQSIDWLVTLYFRLEPLARAEDVARRLRRAKILRLATGVFTSADSGSVFRSLSRKTTYGFEEHLKILSPEILTAASASKHLSAVTEFLRHIGVREADPVSVIDDHIVPFHQGKDWQTLTEEALVGHARYVRDHLIQYVKTKGDAGERALQALRDSIWFYTTQVQEGNRYLHRAPFLYIGDEYGNTNRLPWLLGEAINNLLLHSIYITGANPDAIAKDASAWAAFFRRMGSHTLPRVLPSSAAPSHVASPPASRGSTYTPITANDWIPTEELSQLIHSDDAERKAALVALLDVNWASYQQWQTCKVTRGYQSTEGPSTFVMALRNMVVRERFGALSAFEGQYLDNEDNRIVFGRTVRFAARSLISPSFMTAVGVVALPSAQQVLIRLTELSRADSTDRRAVGALYQFLDQHWEGHEDVITEQFGSASISLAGLGEDTAWCRLDECCWQIPAKLRPAAPIRSLQAGWNKLEDFFCKKLAVHQRMSREEWAATLLRIADTATDASDVGDLARQVYRELEAALRDDGYAVGGESPEWLTSVVAAASVWTTRGEWRQNVGDIFAADDQDVAQLFADSDEVAFIDVPVSDLPRFPLILDALRIHRVSSAPRVPSSAGERFEATEMAALLRRRWPALVRLLYTKNHANYEIIRDDGRLAALSTLPVHAWAPLTLEVVLHMERREHRFECKVREGDDGPELMVDSEEQGNWAAIGRELGQWLGLDEASSDRLGMLLAASDDAAVEKWLLSRQVHQLPPDEVRRLHGIVEPLQEDSTEVSGNEGDEQGEDFDDTLEPIEADSHVPPWEPDIAEDVSDAVSETEASGLGERAPTSGSAPSANPRGFANEPSHAVVPNSNAGSSLGHARGPRSGSSPPITPDIAKSGIRKPQRPAGRFISYVAPAGDVSDENEVNEAAQDSRDQVTQEAIVFVLATETEENRRPELRDHYNPGYDIESFTLAGESDRFIEVKGIKAAWGERGVTMSATQFAFAQKHKTRAWLYIVEFAEDPARRKLWRIQDPASQVTLYGFDHGWRDAATDSSATTPSVPLRENAQWRCDDGVVGVIELIKRAPSFVNIRVKRPDGTTITRTGTEQALALNLVEG